MERIYLPNNVQVRICKRENVKRNEFGGTVMKYNSNFAGELETPFTKKKIWQEKEHLLW